MKFKCVHSNINVADLDKSIDFYEKALNLKVVRTHDAEDGRFRIVFLEGEGSSHQLELTWLADKEGPYNLGDNEIHLAFRADDYEAAYKRHKDLGVIVYENTDMGLYFIADPDGYWSEILPTR
ncbi:lactoylglutathione lyase [Clostridia bacterium]|nr:lactoylglutathione lyase [Clostridia bacterium]